MQKFYVYQQTTTSLSQEAVAAKFKAVPENHILTGIFTPRSHPELIQDPVAIIEARTAEEATALYEEKRANVF